MAQGSKGPRIGLLLAAGHSRRFGRADKLLAVFEDAPLVTHAADALRRSGADRLIAVVRSADVAACLPGFEPVTLSAPEAPQSASLAAGVRRATALGAAGVLVALGDMPRVPAAHLAALLERGRQVAIAASRSCNPSSSRAKDRATDRATNRATDARAARAMPPAWFAARHFDALTDISGDQGARALLRRVPGEALIDCPADWLVDIDRPEDLILPAPNSP